MYSQKLHLTREEIIARLELAYDQDQLTRDEYNTCISKYTFETVECVKKRLALVRQDSINQEIVSQILDNYGWLSIDQLSPKANKAYFYVIQHAPLAFQLKYAEEVDMARERKAITPLEYAFFADRLNTKQGKAQLYGTQAESDNLGNTYFYPLRNKETANTLRGELGIPPMESEDLQAFAQYPTFLNGDTAVLIGHIFRKGNVPLANAIVMKDDAIIGRSNEKGFFVINVRKTSLEELAITILSDPYGTHKVRQVIKGSRDFFQVYVEFE